MEPPVQITPGAYRSWIESIGSQGVSAFFDPMFAWYNQQLTNPLPDQVAQDPDAQHKVWVDVQKALAQTISLENSAGIEEGTTVGFDAYGLLIRVPLD
jgi:hypothetical protein